MKQQGRAPPLRGAGCGAGPHEEEEPGAAGHEGGDLGEVGRLDVRAEALEASAVEDGVEAPPAQRRAAVEVQRVRHHELAQPRHPRVARPVLRPRRVSPQESGLAPATPPRRDAAGGVPGEAGGRGCLGDLDRLGREVEPHHPVPLPCRPRALSPPRPRPPRRARAWP